MGHEDFFHMSNFKKIELSPVRPFWLLKLTIFFPIFECGCQKKIIFYKKSIAPGSDVKPHKRSYDYYCRVSMIHLSLGFVGGGEFAKACNLKHFGPNVGPPENFGAIW